MQRAGTGHQGCLRKRNGTPNGSNEHPRTLGGAGGSGPAEKPRNPFTLSCILRGSCVPPSNRKRLAGFVQKGCLECERGSVSDFATLVRKSYSSSAIRVSTLVLVGVTLLPQCAAISGERCLPTNGTR